MTHVEITDLVAVVRQIDQQRGKYIKSALNTIERSRSLDPATRKAVLDHFNDYTRAIYRILGYTVEE